MSAGYRFIENTRVSRILRTIRTIFTIFITFLTYVRVRGVIETSKIVLIVLACPNSFALIDDLGSSKSAVFTTEVDAKSIFHVDCKALKRVCASRRITRTLPNSVERDRRDVGIESRRSPAVAIKGSGNLRPVTQHACGSFPIVWPNVLGDTKESI